MRAGLRHLGRPGGRRGDQAIAGWKATAVRIPLNEECWLGLSDIKPEYGGTNYINAVKDLVARVEAHGMTPILEMHWSYGQYTGNSAGCSDVHATCQKPMPDMSYAPSFWASVAGIFKDDPAAVFDLFNEPYPDRATSSATDAWKCWRDGGTCPGIPYEVAGMQDLVDSIRGAGAKNVVMAGGLAYSNDLGQWLTYRPTDRRQSRRRVPRVQLQHLFQRELLELHTRPGRGPGAARRRGGR